MALLHSFIDLAVQVCRVSELLTFLQYFNNSISRLARSPLLCSQSTSLV